MKDNALGSFTFVLHSHLPYVLSHGRWPHGTDWLNEAMAETYIPLLDVLGMLIDEGISPKLTLGITPVLTEQINDKSFHEEFKGYLAAKIAAARADKAEFEASGQSHMSDTARMWDEFYSGISESFTGRYKENIIGEFAKLQRQGHIEIITSGATHGYLPLLSRDESVQAQIKQAVKAHIRNYGARPRGIWLPECAYRPGYHWTPPVEGGGPEPYVRKGVDEFLSENGLEFFIVDSHMIGGGKPIGVYLDKFEALGQLWERFSDNYQPKAVDTDSSPYDIYEVGGSSGRKPVAVLSRDPVTGIQVWSSEHGYPGNPHYLDFHKKRSPGGLRYWEVTDTKADMADKNEYQPGKADGVIAEQAFHFVGLVKDSLKKHKENTGKAGLLTSPFDAELFGHWWFEGPKWLYHVLKFMANDPDVELTTGSGYLMTNTERTRVSLPEGSWGEGGFHYIWLNDWTAWTWEQVYGCESKMVELAREFSESDDEKLQGILKQAARELLLLQSSDWQFQISTRSARDYAKMRFNGHVADFNRIAGIAEKYGRGGSVARGDWEYLDITIDRNRLFDDIDPKWWAGVEHPVDIDKR